LIRVLLGARRAALTAAGRTAHVPQLWYDPELGVYPYTIAPNRLAAGQMFCTLQTPVSVTPPG
jgi:hypothetical protein